MQSQTLPRRNGATLAVSCNALLGGAYLVDGEDHNSADSAKRLERNGCSLGDDTELFSGSGKENQRRADQPHPRRGRKAALEPRPTGKI